MDVVFDGVTMATRSKRTFTTEEVLQEILADEDSEDDFDESLLTNGDSNTNSFEEEVEDREDDTSYTELQNVSVESLHHTPDTLVDETPEIPVDSVPAPVSDSDSDSESESETFSRESNVNVSRGRGRTIIRASRRGGSGRGRSRGRGGRGGRGGRATRQTTNQAVWEEGDNFTPPDVPFEEHVGLIPEINAENFTAFDFVKLFITDEVLQHIVDQTNLYADQYHEANEEYLHSKPRSRSHAWKPVNLEEMQVFLGLVFLMGVERKPTLHMYWSTHQLHRSPVFGETMTRDRFLLILKFVHFNDNSAMPQRGDDEYDR